MATTLSHPLEGNEPQGTVVPCAETDIGKSPSTVNSIPGPIPTIIISGPSSPPLVLSSLFGDTTTAEPLSSLGPIPIQPGHIPHALPSPSSSPTTASSLNPAIPMSGNDHTTFRPDGATSS
jgi:hypothetical protein